MKLTTHFHQVPKLRIIAARHRGVCRGTFTVSGTLQNCDKRLLGLTCQSVCLGISHWRGTTRPTGRIFVIEYFLKIYRGN